MIQRNKDLRFSRTPLLFRAFLALTLITALVAPANFVLMTPGPVTKLFPKVLTIKSSSGVKSYPVNGNLLLLTIYVTNPETKVLGGEVLGCWVWGDCVALPRSVVYEDGATDAKERKNGEKDMQESQSVALTAALKTIARKFPEVKIGSGKSGALTDSAINVSLEDTGGPSGGLVFTLGLIDLLTPTDILKGRVIAGTGTIAADGSVGAIGGVAEKIIGASKAGANILFVSQENCGELPGDTRGLSVIAISSIDQAIDYLLTASPALNSAGIHGCASVGA